MHDQPACGGRFRVLDIVDDVTREFLAAIPDTAISGRRVDRELTASIATRDKPKMIVSDRGTEFTSNVVLAWSKDYKVDLHYIAPGKPMQNSLVESFHGHMQDELLDEGVVLNLHVLQDARPTALSPSCRWASVSPLSVSVNGRS